MTPEAARTCFTTFFYIKKEFLNLVAPQKKHLLWYSSCVSGIQEQLSKVSLDQGFLWGSKNVTQDCNNLMVWLELEGPLQDGRLTRCWKRACVSCYMGPSTGLIENSRSKTVILPTTTHRSTQSTEPSKNYTQHLDATYEQPQTILILVFCLLEAIGVQPSVQMRGIRLHLWKESKHLWMPFNPPTPSVIRQLEAVLLVWWKGLGTHWMLGMEYQDSKS